jgi:hypothetical protein
VADAGCVVVVIPHGRQVVIDLSSAGTSSAAGGSGDSRHLVIVKDPGAMVGEADRTGRGKSFRA